MAIGAILTREKSVSRVYKTRHFQHLLQGTPKNYTREFHRANPAPIHIKLASSGFFASIRSVCGCVCLETSLGCFQPSPRLLFSSVLSMSRDPSSLTLASETDVLTVSPLIGPATCTASSVQSPTILSGTPLTASISKVLLDIDALPSPPCSLAIVTTEPLGCASPLTERALRSQRRDALRATCDVAVARSLDTIRSHDIVAESDVPARIKKILSNTTFHTSTTCSCIRLSYFCNHPSSSDARG